jgi:hypothetical protein
MNGTKQVLEHNAAQVGRLEKGIVPPHVGSAGIKRHKLAARRLISMIVCI